MLCVEDCNSILQHFGKEFVDFYILDTRDISSVDSYFGYDFIEVFQTTNAFTFEIKNSLWTGGYRVLDSDGEDITVSLTGNSLQIAGEDLTYVVLELELSTIRTPFNSPTDIHYEVSWFSVIRPFYEQNLVSVLYTDQDVPVNHLMVFIPDYQHTTYTNSEGFINVRLNPKAAGDYTSELVAYLDPTDISKGNISYRYPYKLIRVELPVRLVNDSIVRDKTNILEFEFLFDDDYDITESMLFDDNHIRLKFDGKYYEVNEYADNVFSFKVPFGSAYKVNMQLEILGNDYIDNYVLDYSIDTVYATFDSASALKSELESDDSASTVVFSGSVLDASILISRDVRIIFSGVCTSSLDNVFTVTGGVFTVSNANFTGKNFITINRGSVELVDSSFNHCTSTIVKGTGDLTVDTCSFVDNNACIDVTGTVNVENSLFDLSDTDYLDTSVIPFLNVYGNLNIDYSTFELDLADLDHLGYSYVICKISEDFTTNGVDNKNLFVNDAFPVGNNNCNISVKSDDYRITSKSNKSFTYTIVNTNTVYSNKMSFVYIGE